MKTHTLCQTIFATLMLGFNLGVANAEPSARINTRDLDLGKPQDVATLYQRIEQRAQRVCRDASSPWDASREKYVKKCAAAAVDTAVASVNSEALSTLHASKTQPPAKVAQTRE
jgi:UrcA family protein